MTPALVDRTAAAFRAAFGAAPAAWFQAPGRVNLIGEHTDYNGGAVLPAAIDRWTVAAVRPRSDGLCRVLAVDRDGAQSAWPLAGPIHRDPAAPWSDYLRGVCVALARHGALERGLDVAVAGDIPQGAGLSSSASLSVVFALALAAVNGLSLAPLAVAQAAQAAENEFAGCRCGIMDQLASVAGRADHALLIDCAALRWRTVPLPATRRLVVIDSGVHRGLVDSAYQERRAQCEAAAAALGVTALAEARPEDLAAARDRLDPVVFRRARHVIGEHRRTLAAAEALAAGELERLDRAMAESHRSMREDFQITTPEIDALVAAVEAVLDGAGGVRMTGGGFGGCVVAFVPPEAVARIEAEVLPRYRAQTGCTPRLFLCRAVDGAGPFEPGA
ncbi:MAG: galactokinase [Gammaproteobacteria bacterium]|nr:MAG: galactokinase [Gammaproteobacteria bacterium]